MTQPFLKKIFLILCISIFFIPGLLSEPLIVSPPLNNVPVGYHLEYMEDAIGNLTINDIADPAFSDQWMSGEGKCIQLGNINAIYWARFTLANDTTADIDLLVVQKESFAEHLDLYVPENGTFRVIKTGSAYNYYERPYDSLYFVFPITLPANSENTYYLRQQTTIMNFSLYLYSKQQYVKKEKKESLIHLILFGILLAMCLYHIIIYFIIRQVEYLYYILSVASITLFLITVTSYGYQFLWPGVPYLSIIFYMVSAFAMNVFIILFTNKQLEMKKNFPLIYKIGSVLLIGNGVMFIVTLILPYSIAGMFMSITIVTSNLYILICSILMSFKRCRTGYFFFLATVMYNIGYALFSLAVNNVFVMSEAIYWFFIDGVCAFAILYALTLADKMNVMRISLSTLNDSLEEKVEERTRELHTANEKLKEIDTIKSNFFANISHEIRTPLTLILSPVESVLQGDFKKPVDEPFFRNIRNNAVRLLRLVNNILDFSKLEAKRMSLKVKQVDIVSLLDHYLTTISSAVESKAITLHFDSKFESMPLFIDGKKIGTVFMNIFSNALKFTDNNGSITVTIDADDDACSIKVADSGIGIPESKLDAIFDRFSRAENGTTDKHEGTGIGLALAREFVILHGGTITVTSKYIDDFPDDHGSTFTITIPRGKEHLEGNADVEFAIGEQLSDDIFDASHREFSGFWKMYDLMENKEDNNALQAFQQDFPEEESGDKADRQKILVVDDNTDMRNFIRFLLQDQYVVYTAVNGQEGLDKTLALNPDLVVTDVMMPVMNGYQLTGRIKTHDELKRIPVLMLTAKIEISNKIEGLEYGADDYLTKPFNSKELLTRIKSMLRLKQMQDELLDMNKTLSHRVKEATADIVQREYEALEVLGDAAEYRDPETGAHIERVARYSKLIAEGMGLDEDTCELLYYASPLHDIGKIGIEDAVLQKPGRLTKDEFEIIKKHSRIGYEILKNKKSKYLQAAATISLTHHEKYDGNGYPNALSGEDIHVYGRIVAVADVFDAVTSKRCYKDRWPFERAVELIINEKGKHFDPAIVDVFIANIEQIKEIFFALKEE